MNPVVLWNVIPNARLNRMFLVFVALLLPPALNFDTKDDVIHYCLANNINYYYYSKLSLEGEKIREVIHIEFHDAIKAGDVYFLFDKNRNLVLDFTEHHLKLKRSYYKL